MIAENGNAAATSTEPWFRLFGYFARADGFGESGREKAIMLKKSAPDGLVVYTGGMTTHRDPI
jgi:hypothetical protein